MSLTLFLAVLTFGSIATGILTEAIKKTCENANKEISANTTALICALVIGIGGTACTYVYMNIPFSATNILTMCIMGFLVWIGATIGYDKIIQLVKQIAEKGK